MKSKSILHVFLTALASVTCVGNSAFASDGPRFAGVSLGVSIEQIPVCVPVPKKSRPMVCQPATQTACEAFNKRTEELDAKYPDYFPPPDASVCRKVGPRATYVTDPEVGPSEEGFALHELRSHRPEPGTLFVGQPTFVLTKHDLVYKLVYDYRGEILPIDHPRQIRTIENALIELITDYVDTPPSTKKMLEGCSGEGKDVACYHHVRIEWAKDNATFEIRRDDARSGRLTIMLAGYEKGAALALPSFGE